MVEVRDNVLAIPLGHSHVGVVLAHRKVRRDGYSQRDSLLRGLNVFLRFEVSEAILRPEGGDEGERDQTVVEDGEGGVDGHVEAVASAQDHLRVVTVEPTGVVIQVLTSKAYTADFCSFVEGAHIEFAKRQCRQLGRSLAVLLPRLVAVGVAGVRSSGL